MRFRSLNLHSDERGTTAIEFAIVGPVFIFVLIGIFYLCMCMSVVAGMHYAVEEGARCASVRTTVCSDPTTTLTYTQNHYFGPSGPPIFSYDPAAACGHAVSASINYVVNFGLKEITVPISAAACFP